MVKWGSGKKGLRERVQFKYKFRFTNPEKSGKYLKYWLELYPEVPANILVTLFEGVLKAKDPDIVVDIPDKFYVDKSLYEKILANKRLVKWLDQVEKQIRRDYHFSFKILNAEVQENGMFYVKTGDLFKVTIKLQGDYTF